MSFVFNQFFGRNTLNAMLRSGFISFQYFHLPSTFLLLKVFCSRFQLEKKNPHGYWMSLHSHFWVCLSSYAYGAGIIASTCFIRNLVHVCCHNGSNKNTVNWCVHFFFVSFIFIPLYAKWNGPPHQCHLH